MENCHPKLSEYFDAGYSKMQEEIALFVKGFPKIQLDNLSSINDLIGLLIRQNSILANRLKEQMAQIKDNYKRA